jgi:predicted Zn-dependent protease
MGALTWAEEAIAAGKLTDPGYAMIASTRARYGLHKGTHVKPEDEGPLVAALKQASTAIYTSKYADAHKALDAIDKKWPGSAGALAFRCDLSMREGAIGPAKAYCAKALAVDPDESWALYLDGVLAFRDTTPAGTKAGIAKLQRAIAVDPDLGQAWRALAKAYIRAKDQAALEKLSQDYAAKFGAPLPQ